MYDCAKGDKFIRDNWKIIYDQLNDDKKNEYGPEHIFESDGTGGFIIFEMKKFMFDTFLKWCFKNKMSINNY
jgi:hypothetical protein